MPHPVQSSSGTETRGERLFVSSPLLQCCRDGRDRLDAYQGRINEREHNGFLKGVQMRPRGSCRCAGGGMIGREKVVASGISHEVGQSIWRYESDWVHRFPRDGTSRFPGAGSGCICRLRVNLTRAVEPSLCSLQSLLLGGLRGVSTAHTLCNDDARANADFLSPANKTMCESYCESLLKGLPFPMGFDSWPRLPKGQLRTAMAAVGGPRGSGQKRPLRVG